MRSPALLAVVALAMIGSAVRADEPARSPHADSQTAGAHFERGRRLLRKRKYADAIAELQAAYALDPRSEPLYELALAYDLSGDPGHAVELYRTYLARESKGKTVEQAKADLALLEEQLSEVADDAKREADARARAQAELAAKHANVGGEAKVRLAAAMQRVTDLEKDLQARTAARDDARAAAELAGRDGKHADALLEVWRARALSAPTGGGRGRRLLGLLGMVGGASLIGAGSWYGIDAQALSDTVSSAPAWSVDDDAFVARGELGDRRFRELVPAGSIAAVLGTICFGWGEWSAMSRRSEADVRRAVEGAGR